MYLNHFDYFKYMTKALCEEVESYPSQWWCPALGKMAAADWIQEVGHECESLHKEVLVVTNEVKDVRKLVRILSWHLSHHQKFLDPLLTEADPRAAQPARVAQDKSPHALGFHLRPDEFRRGSSTKHYPTLRVEIN